MRTSIAVLLAAISFENCAVAANLVVNGDFETGFFTGWTITPAAIGNDLLLDTAFPHSGANSALFAATRHLDDSLEQSVPTTAGTNYQVTFWLANRFVDPQDNDFKASFGSSLLLSLVNVPMSPYTEYVFTVQATGSSSVLRFSGADQPAGLNLDDVSVVAIPEPSGLLLLALGAAGCLAARRRTRRVAAAEQA